jgi:hypothetical protein
MKIQVVERNDSPTVIGKEQFVCSSKYGKISIIQLKGMVYVGETWEIYCLDGDLFEDIERFNTFEEAKAKCKVYLK